MTGKKKYKMTAQYHVCETTLANSDHEAEEKLLAEMDDSIKILDSMDSSNENDWLWVRKVSWDLEEIKND